jgi:ankyrin repeat protein
MTKRGHLNKSWKERYFELSAPGVLRYWDKKGDAKPKGELCLINTTFKTDIRKDKTDGSRPFVFKATVGDEDPKSQTKKSAERGTLLLAVQTEADMLEWINALHAAWTDVEGNNCLTRAASSGNQLEMTRALGRGTNPNLRNREGDTPLICAVQHGHKGAVEQLLAAGCDPNTKNACGSTPVMTAIIDEQREILQLLVDGGAALDARNNDGATALHLATAQGRSRDTAILFKAARRPDPNISNAKGMTPLMVACSSR